MDINIAACNQVNIAAPFAPPPLGHCATLTLARALLEVRDGHPLPPHLREVGATVEAIRDELARRERVGAGVRQ
jgi:hypothetical protein